MAGVPGSVEDVFVVASTAEGGEHIQGHAEGAAPAVADGDFVEGGEEFPECRFEVGADTGVVVAEGTVVVEVCIVAAEGDAVVDGEAEVMDEVACGFEAGAVLVPTGGDELCVG